MRRGKRSLTAQRRSSNKQKRRGTLQLQVIPSLRYCRQRAGSANDSSRLSEKFCLADAVVPPAGRATGAYANGQPDDAPAEEEKEGEGEDAQADDGADEAMTDAPEPNEGHGQQAAEQGPSHDPDDRYVAEEEEDHRHAQRQDWPLFAFASECMRECTCLGSIFCGAALNMNAVQGGRRRRGCRWLRR